MKFVVLLVLFANGLIVAQDIKSYAYTFPGSGVTFRMIAVPGGKFIIGSNSGDAEDDEKPQRPVELSPFWIGQKEVTFAEWDLFFKDATIRQDKVIDGITRPTVQYIDYTWGMGREPAHPVNSVSQQAAMMYCKWLYSKTGIFYRLPTEAEWEYACKAGSATDFPIDYDPSQLQEYAYFEANSDGKFHVTGKRKPNAWGLYDMLGNLSEWTLDQYSHTYYQTIGKTNPITSPGTKYPRVVRGGSFSDGRNELRCTNRIPSQAAWNKTDPQVPKSIWWLTDGKFIGFRIVRPVNPPSKEVIENFYARYLKN